MDKRSEQKKDHKECGDVDIGVHDYKAGGKREQLNGLWGVVSEDVVGLSRARLLTGRYKKPREGEKKEEKPDLLDTIMEMGPPLLNVSKPRRVF